MDALFPFSGQLWYFVRFIVIWVLYRSAGSYAGVLLNINCIVRMMWALHLKCDLTVTMLILPRSRAYAYGIWRTAAADRMKLTSGKWPAPPALVIRSFAGSSVGQRSLAMVAMDTQKYAEWYYPLRVVRHTHSEQLNAKKSVSRERS